MISQKKTTISDIAKAAGVSKATVSYVINRRKTGFQISDETARRVLNVCRELNYRPDEAAIRLSECRKNPLKLLVVSPWIYSQFSDFMARLNTVLNRYVDQSQLVVTYGAYSGNELGNLLRPSLLKKFDAVLVVGTRTKDDQWLRRNAGELGKVVLLNRKVEGILSCSGSDQTSIRQLLKKINLAHYERLMLVRFSGRNYCEILRGNGFSACCEDAGRKCEEIAIDNYNMLWEQLRPNLLNRKEKTLIFVPQYVPAAQLLAKAQAEGIAVPENLGIITYDRHLLLDQFIAPALTTVNPCFEEMTEKTLEIIFALREGKRRRACTVRAEPCPGGTTVNKETPKTLIS